jgi:excisionase family DNA binding protein
MTDDRKTDAAPVHPEALPRLRGRATVTVEEAAKLLGISRAPAYRAVKAGQIPAIRVGGRLLVPVPKLLAMLGVEVPPAGDYT